MECYTGIDDASASAAQLMMKAASLITPSQWLLAFFLVLAFFLYNFIEIHLIGDLLRGMRGDPVTLIYNPNSDICAALIAKCPILRGRYLPTPWLPSPHLQTAFLQFLGRPPVFQYRRQIFHVSDGGTIALDWLSSNASRNHALNKAFAENDLTPIVVVVPGLTSDSASSYIRHIVYQLSKQGWDVVVSNHRGLGGISITSDCFYNAGWTEDLRTVVNYLHQEHPKAPLFAVGTSIGANILVFINFFYSLCEVFNYLIILELMQRYGLFIP
ncbi:Phospholipase [Nymphaea thermarum]|nr:Phospholipase [Nymphaea thermarum]